MAVCFMVFLVAPGFSHAQTERKISYKEYFDKVHGGWTGKALGLALGVPKEFTEPWPPSPSEYFAQIPDHFSDLVSGDDEYVPLVGQLALKEYGIHATQEQFLQEWDKRLFSGRIWVSCDYALDLYRAGIKPPLTGSPGYNDYWYDMAAQMSTDHLGWSAPGLINVAAAMGDSLSHTINWGVGADGGVFVAALDSEAFFTSDIEELIRRARAVLPAHSRYGEMVDELLRLHKEQPDWRMARQWWAKKYSTGVNFYDLTGLTQGAVVVLALLYGDGDFAKSLLISEKCTWDSDTNPATVGGVLGTVIGFSHIDPRWRMVLHDTYENYCIRGLPHWMTFSEITRDTLEIGEQVIKENGGQVYGREEDRVFTIPFQEPKMLARQEKVTAELVAQNQRELEQYFRDRLKGVTEKWDSQWKMVLASFETPPEVLPNYFGRATVLKAQPGPRGVVLERTVALAPAKHHYLRVGVAHRPPVLCEATGQQEFGSWQLEVQVDGKKIADYSVSTHDGMVVWEDPQFDLTPYAGKTVRLSLIARQVREEVFYRASFTSYWSGAEIISLDQPEPWR